jgi:hypothetical protein
MRCTSTGAKIIPAAHTAPTMMNSAVVTRLASRAASSLPRVVR